MDITLDRPTPPRTVAAMPSKSGVHRVLICAALADAPTTVVCGSESLDTAATARCLRALGAGVTFSSGAYQVDPIHIPAATAVLDCGESGSTLRFLLPLAAALGCRTEFRLSGRLGSRPISQLSAALERHGARITHNGDTICCEGAVKAGPDGFTVDGSVSSQFVSGMLFACVVCGGKVTVTGKAESLPYIELTLDTLKLFGAVPERREAHVITPNAPHPLVTPGTVRVEGDWSNAAFFLVAGAIGSSPVTVTGLDPDSRQGDRAIVTVLRSMGAKLEFGPSGATAYPSQLSGTIIDASDIPDLVPVLSVAAAAASGTTVIKGAGRLRLKESDRLSTTAAMLGSLGGRITVADDGLVITGGALRGGTVDSANDHRIAMSAAVASLLCTESVTVRDAGAVSKSYPRFWEDFTSCDILGK